MPKHLLPALLLALAASCTSVSVIPRYGGYDLGGHVGISSSGSPQKNDLKGIGLEDDSSVPGGRVDLEAGGTHLTVAASDSSHGGSGTLQRTISEGGTTIPAGTAIDSEFDVTLVEGMVTWDLVPGDLVEAGIGLGVVVLDLDAEFTAPSLSATVATDEVLPVPVLALRAGLDLERFDVSAVLGAMDVHAGGDEIAVYDLDLMARFRVLGAAGRRIGAIVAGYRYVDAAAEYDDSDSDVDAVVRLSGPYIGISLGF